MSDDDGDIGDMENEEYGLVVSSVRLCDECEKRPAVWAVGVWRGGVKSKLCRLCARAWKRWRADHHKSLARR